MQYVKKENDHTYLFSNNFWPKKTIIVQVPMLKKKTVSLINYRK